MEVFPATTLFEMIDHFAAIGMLRGLRLMGFGICTSTRLYKNLQTRPMDWMGRYRLQMASPTKSTKNSISL